MTPEKLLEQMLERLEADIELLDSFEENDFEYDCENVKTILYDLRSELVLRVRPWDY